MPFEHMKFSVIYHRGHDAFIFTTVVHRGHSVIISPQWFTEATEIAYSPQWFTEATVVFYNGSRRQHRVHYALTTGRGLRGASRRRVPFSI